jgi:hypothetical protein
MFVVQGSITRNEVATSIFRIALKMLRAKFVPEAISKMLKRPIMHLDLLQRLQMGRVKLCVCMYIYIYIYK